MTFVSTVVNAVAELKPTAGWGRRVGLRGCPVVKTEGEMKEDGRGREEIWSPPVPTVVNAVAELKPWQNSRRNLLQCRFHGGQRRGRIEAFESRRISSSPTRFPRWSTPWPN